MASNDTKEEIPPFVEVKSERIECVVDIKIEPPDQDDYNSENPPETDDYHPETNDYHPETNDYHPETNDYQPETNVYRPEIETISIKIEPTFYENEENPYADLQARFETSPQRPFTPASKPVPTRKYKKRNRSDSDEEYRPPKHPKKKKIKELVKKTYTTKAKKPENLYAEEVTQYIEVITIDEEERLREYKELWHSRQHMRYTCELCAVGYVMEEPYLAHMKSHSPKSGDHECDICHCRVKTADTLYRHRLRHYRRYRCVHCDSQHKDKETASCHVMSSHSRRAFICTECGKGFKRPAYLKKHVAQQHTKLERHECSVCQRVFHDRAGLRSHIRTHSEEARHPPTQSVICDTCSRRFRNKTSLRRHIMVHMDGRAERCPHCTLEFKTRKGLRLHVGKQHQGLVTNEHAACPLCPRVCTNPTLLRQHIRRMHSDRTKKYQCDHCKRMYWSKGEVRSHILWSHVRTQSSVHVCECGRVFRTRARLRDHVNVQHRHIVPQRTHLCHCGKGFTSKQVLTRHMKIHEDLSYPCPECGATFKSEAYVKVHFKLRHLNMTRAQIKAQKQPRQLTYLTGKKPYKQEKRKKKQKIVEEIKEEDRISVPLFDFVNLKREPEDFD